MLQDIRLQVVADRIRIPLRSGQQALHAVGVRLARMLGQLPPILTLDRAEQTIPLPPHPLALLCAGEAWPDPLLDLVPPCCPGGHLYLRELVFVHDLTPSSGHSCHTMPLPATVKLWTLHELVTLRERSVTTSPKPLERRSTARLASSMAGRARAARREGSGEVAQPSPELRNRCLELAERDRCALLKPLDVVRDAEVADETR